MFTAPPLDPPRHLWVGATLAASAALGIWITRDPSFLHVDAALGVHALAALAVAMGIAAVIVRWPAAGLLLLVAAVYLNLSQVLVRDHGFPSFLQLLAAPLFVAALLERRGRALPPVRLLLPALLAAHVFAILLSTTVAADRELADERLLEVVKGLALVLLLVLLANSRPRIRAVAWTIVGTAALLASLALVQAATGDFTRDFGGLARIKHAHIHGSVFQPRVAGPLGDPNFFAQILLVAVPVALFLGWEESTAGRRGLAFAGAAVIATGTVLTYSRGGALALGAVLLGAILVRGVSLRRLGVGLVVLVAAASLLPRDFAERVATVSEILPGQEEDVLPEDSSFRERMLLAGVAWEMFRARPVAGVGAGNYTVHFDDYAARVGSSARDYGSGDAARYPHNLYLELGAEGGLAALLTFLAVTGSALVLLHRARRRFLEADDPLMAGLAAAFALALAGYLASSVFLHGHFQRYLWLLLGAGAALHVIAPRHDAAPLSSPAPTPRNGHGPPR